MLERADLRRFTIFATLAAAVVILIVWKYFSLMVIDHPPGGSGDRTALVERGPILDRQGRVLAIETRQYSVSAWIPSVRSKEKDAQLLSAILHISRKRLLNTLSTHTGFVYVERKVPDPVTARIRKLIERGELTGISLDPSFARIYPNGKLAGHVIGYVGTDNQGLAGIEYAANSLLSPTPPRSTAGHIILGDRLYLTIDENVQYEANKLAGMVYRKVHPRAVILLVERAKTGSILADVSYPEFDPNNFAGYSAQVRQDFPVSYIYEPGSVMKIFTISSFLQLGGITPRWKVYDDGYYIRHLADGHTIRIHGLAPHEWEDAQLIIKWSSNVGAAYASDTVSKEAFYRMLRAFGFGSSTNVGLPGEEIGILRPASVWGPRSKPDIAFGQEIGVTAMQIVAAATSLANGGVLLKPHIISKVVAPDGRIIERFPRQPIRRVVSAKVAREMLSDMETGTEPGAWAYGARLNGIPVSAKTGTSQTYDPRTGTYSKTAYVSSSISIFPTTDPRFIIYAAIIDPKTTHYWGFQLATPLVQKVSAFVASYFREPKTTDHVVTVPRAVTVSPVLQVRVGRRLPDLIGLSKRAVLPLLIDPELKVTIHGQGWVVKQRPAPGTPIRAGMKVALRFSRSAG